MATSYKEKLSENHSDKLLSFKGKGLILGIRCNKSNQDICNIARKKGLLLVAASNNVVRLLPPLTVNKQEINIALKLLDETLKEIS